MNDFTDSSEPFDDSEPASDSQPNDSQPNDSQPNDSQPTGDSGSRPQAPAGAVGGRPPLRRAYHGRMMGGVAAGIAGYLDVDPTIVRVAFAVLTVFGGAGAAAYVACLFLIPEEGTDISLASSIVDSIQAH